MCCIERLKVRIVSDLRLIGYGPADFVVDGFEMVAHVDGDSWQLEVEVENVAVVLNHWICTLR